MKKISVIIISVLTIVFVLGNFLPYYFFPSDILSYFPSFSEYSWQKPHNSLLADPVYQFEPWRHYAKERIISGEFPLWNSLNGKGAPFLANPQNAIFYPLTFIYYFFPTKVALFSMSFLKLFFYGIFSFLYLKSLKLTRSSSLIGSFVIMFSAFPIVWLLWPQTNVFILFPFILFITEKIYVSTKSTHRWYLLLSLTYFTGILGGHPETLFHVGLLHGMYVFLRLWKQWKKILYSFLAIGCGFLLGAFQLIPFLEYLCVSYVLNDRTTHVKEFYLPIKSFIINFIPFVMGAPHLQFYKSIDPKSNFQEVIGGYVSTAVFLFVILFSFFMKKNKKIVLLFFVIFIFLDITYNVWPFNLLLHIPYLSASVNQRLIGFSGFAIGVLFTFILDSIEKRKISLTNKLTFILNTTMAIFLFVSIFLLVIKSKIHFFPTEKLGQFFIFLSNHIIFLLITSLLFFFFILMFLSKKNKLTRLFSVLLLITFFSQSLFLFWNYIPFTSESSYYPNTRLIKDLKKLEKEDILEVGNPLLPPNINLIYGLSSVENDDAMEVLWYKKEFDKTFPIKNQWKKVENIDSLKLEKFSIRYIVSDFNLLLDRDKIQPSYKKILSSITKDTALKIRFKGNGKILNEIRILTANFNRSNTCDLSVVIVNVTLGQTVEKSNIFCKDVRDFMYYTFPIENVQLDQGHEYAIFFTSHNATEDNSVALWGSAAGAPYVELFYQSSSENKKSKHLALRFRGKSYYIFENTRYKEIEGVEKYTTIFQKHEEIQYLISLNQDKKIEVKKTYFPGWQAYIDGENVSISNSKPFMNVFVKKGDHILELSYNPYSFWIGLFVSLCSFIGICVYLIRNEIKERRFGTFKKKWNLLTRRINSQTEWWEHSGAIFVGMILGVYLYLVSLKFVPLKFHFPYTTAINWLSIHKYPKQQDFYLFLLGVSITISTTLIVWGFFIWLKIKKYN